MTIHELNEIIAVAEHQQELIDQLEDLPGTSPHLTLLLNYLNTDGNTINRPDELVLYLETILYEINKPAVV